MRVRRLHKRPAQLEIAAFLNLIVVLVPFLLSTARGGRGCSSP